MPRSPRVPRAATTLSTARSPPSLAQTVVPALIEDGRLADGAAIRVPARREWSAPLMAMNTPGLGPARFLRPQEALAEVGLVRASRVLSDLGDAGLVKEDERDDLALWQRLGKVRRRAPRAPRASRRRPAG